MQTDSSEHSAVLTTTQLTNLTAKGREVVSMLRTIPGVQYQADQDSTGGSYGTGTPNIAGSFSGTNILAVDGVVSNDQGTPNIFSSVTTLDAIGEVKVLLNSYQAEYAGNGGPIVQVVTRGGGREFHGSAYEYIRNDALNANDFFNNRNGVQAAAISLQHLRRIPRRTGLYTRALEPGQDQDVRLLQPGAGADLHSRFAEFLHHADRAGTPGRFLADAGRERQGDSDHRHARRRAVPRQRDSQEPPEPERAGADEYPAAAQLLQPGDQRRQLQLSRSRKCRRTRNGASFSGSTLSPRDKDRFFVRGKTWIAQQQGYAVAGGASPVGFFAQCYCFTEDGLATGDTHIFSPTVIMEFNAGVRHNREAWHPYGDNEINKVLRSAIGYNLGQWYPNANASGFIPRFSFGGVPSAPNVSYDNRLLTGGTDFTFNFSDSVAITTGTHNIKVGFDVYRIREYEGEQSIFSGTFDFGKNTLNPLDSNYAFSNAALGVFNSYTESNVRYGANMRQSLVEWFAQDSWKVTQAAHASTTASAGPGPARCTRTIPASSPCSCGICIPPARLRRFTLR